VEALDSLVKDVILQPDFSVEHLHDFKAAQELKLLDSSSDDPASASSPTSPTEMPHLLSFNPRDGWGESTVKIPLSCPSHKFASESHAPTVSVGGIWHRDLLALVKEVYEGPQFYNIHLKGFTQMWKPSENEDSEHVHWEAYTSDAWLDLEAQLRTTLPLPKEGDKDLENLIVPIQIYSDSAHLADFGTASVWPIYAFIVSVSKYIRSKPDMASALHWAYIPSV
jgi:hypothetical protein